MHNFGATGSGERFRGRTLPIMLESRGQRREIGMPSWKTVFLRGAGFGAGFAVALSSIAVFCIWYNERPKPPKPWNKKAIAAEYDFIGPAGGENDLAFHYVLQNNTDFDYRIDSDAGIEITSKLKKENGFSLFANRYVTTDYPIFVPARSRVWIALNIPYPYPVREKENPTPDERKEFATGVAKYVTDEFSNLDGFALFDIQNRYEIDFPNGWEARAKETPATK
jgi:hypothetical protein